MSISLIKNFAWSFFQQIGGHVINFAITIFLTRLLSPEQFGLMAITYVFYIIGERVLDLGLGQSIIRTRDISNEDYNSVFVVNVGIAITYYLLLFLFAPLIANFYENEDLILLIRISGLSIILMGFASIQNVKLTKDLKFKSIAFINIISSLISGCLGVIAALNGFGVWSLVVVYLSTQVVKILILWIKTDFYPKFIFNYIYFKKHYEFGYKITLTQVIDAIYTNFIVLIVGKFYTLTDTGYYSRADSTKNIFVTTFYTPIQRLILPYFSKIESKSDLEASILKIISIVFYIFCPLLLITSIISEPLIVFVFSEKWIAVAPYFSILCIAAIIFPLESINNEFMKINNRADLSLKTEIIRKTIGVIIILTAYSFSLMILVKSLILISIINFFVFAYLNQKELSFKISSQLKVLYPTLITAVFTVFLLRFTLNWINFENNLSEIIFGYGFGLFTFVILSNLFKLKSGYYFNKRIIHVLKMNKLFNYGKNK